MVRGKYGAVWLALALSAVGACSSGPSLDSALATKYEATCAACHETGAANAPRAHDDASWAPRLAKGEDALLKSVRIGMLAMPPMGRCEDCSEADFRALIAFMSR